MKSLRMPPRAYSYVRFSTPEQMRGDSFRRQTELASQYAAKKGLVLDSDLTFQDLGVSAFRGRNARSGALRMFLDAVDDGIIETGSYLLVESFDRISRDAIMEAQGLFTLIINRGITLVTLQDGREYSRDGINANPMDLIASLMIMMRAHEESATKSRRLKAAWEGKRLKAAETPLTARVPGWLHLKDDRTFEVLEDRAAIVRRIFDLTLRGDGQHRIASTLNDEKVPVFGKGKFWHRSYIAKLLRNPATVGTFVPHKWEHSEGTKKRVPLDPIPNYYPAIVDRERFERVQSLWGGSRSPKRGRHAHRPLRNVLGGLARCPRCSGSMTLVTKGPAGGTRRLVCSRAKAGAGCLYHSVQYSDVEETLRREADALIASCPPDSVAGRQLQARMDEIDGQIEVVQDAIANVLEAIENGGFRSGALHERLSDLENELQTLRDEQEEVSRRLMNADSLILEKKLEGLQALFDADEWNKDEINLLLRQLLVGVVIDYGTGQLEFQWKHHGSTSLMFTWPTEP